MFPPCSVCVQISLSYKKNSHIGVRARSTAYDLILTKLIHQQWPYFQISPHSEALGFWTSTHKFGGNTIKPITEPIDATKEDSPTCEPGLINGFGRGWLHWKLSSLAPLPFSRVKWVCPGGLDPQLALANSWVYTLPEARSHTNHSSATTQENSETDRDVSSSVCLGVGKVEMVRLRSYSEARMQTSWILIHEGEPDCQGCAFLWHNAKKAICIWHDYTFSKWELC